MTLYHENQIEAVTITQNDDGSLRITIRPKLETLYFLPGVSVEETSKAIFVQPVRCHIHKQCSVDLPAQPNPSLPGSYWLTLPATTKAIRMRYATGTTVSVWPLVNMD